MKIGISTACFYPRPLEEGIAHIAALGLREIEIFFNTDSEFRPPYTAGLARLLREHDLNLVSVHPYTSLMEGILLFSDYARRTEDGFEQYRRYFATAAELGARYLTLHGERMMPGMQETPAAAERKLERYRRLCQTAKEEGMIVAQENVAWCRSSDPAYLQRLFENIPELRYTLDIKQAHRAGHQWQEYFEIVAPRLVNVHINDFDEAHSCLLPGEGSLDYDALFSALRGAEYHKQVLIEVYSSNYAEESQIADAARFLRDKACAAGYDTAEVV
ncbi:MAG: sugar phosphate isomerase/epimerase [Clostridiaceae bacterium]|nr:sugar phosphate isomerase/epimerase [Clostridiaceae bacterium]